MLLLKVGYGREYAKYKLVINNIKMVILFLAVL